MLHSFRSGTDPEHDLTNRTQYFQWEKETLKQSNRTLLLEQFLLVLLEWTHEGRFLRTGLEAAMTHLAAGVNEVQVNFLQGNTLRLDQQRLQEQGHTSQKHNRSKYTRLYNVIFSPIIEYHFGS